MGARTRVATLPDGAELWREVGTDRWWVHERVDDPMPSTSVRDVRARKPIGRFPSFTAAARHVDMNRRGK